MQAGVDRLEGGGIHCLAKGQNVATPGRPLRAKGGMKTPFQGLLVAAVMLCALAGWAAGAAATRLAQVDDLKDKRIGALQGSAHVDYVVKTWPQATLLQYNSPADLLLAVKTGKVDAALSDAER